MRRGLRLTAMVLGIVWLAAGCRVFDEGRLDGSLDEDAGLDAGTDGEVPDAGLCLSNRPPERPAVADANGLDTLYVLRDVVLDQRADRWRTIGFDLDGLCSVRGAPQLECDPSPDPIGEPVDGENGTDNAYGQWVSELLIVLVPDFEEDVRSEHEAGNLAILLTLREWSGLGDDPRVEVVVSHSAAATDTDGGAPLRWDGTDRWLSRADGFLDGDPARPLLIDDNAYVTRRTLVARLPFRADFVLSSGDRRLRVRLTDTLLTATISADGNTLQDVLLSGRWGLLDVADAASELGLCTPADASILTLRTEAAADIRSTPGSGGAGVSCDAVSVGLEFTGQRAIWDGLRADPPLTDPCASGMP